MSNGGSGRRLSFGALLLIALGVLLLANNFVQGFRAAELFARYWPVLLILWGLVKLIDNLQARSSGQPAPRSLTGGDIFLLIVVIFVGLAMNGALEFDRRHPGVLRGSDGCAEWLGQETYAVGDDVETREVKPGAPFRIQVGRGAVRLVGAEGNQLRVTSKRVVCASSEAKANERAKDSRVEIVEDGGGYQIRTRGDSLDQNQRVDVEVSVPKKAAVTIRSERGGATVNGVEGNVVVTVERGDVEVTDVTGDVEVEVRTSGSDTMIRNVRGNVKLTGPRGGGVDIAEVTGNAYVQGEFEGRIQLQAIGKEARFLSRRTNLTVNEVKGRIEFGSGGLRVEDANGSMALVSSPGRDVELENVRGVIRIENRNAGDVDIRFKETPRAEVTVMADRGDVTVAMPANASFEVSAFSRNGEVESEFIGPELKSIEANRDRNIEGRIGTKGPKLMLRTSYGTIRLRKEG